MDPPETYEGNSSHVWATSLDDGRYFDNFSSGLDELIRTTPSNEQYLSPEDFDDIMDTATTNEQSSNSAESMTDRTNDSSESQPHQTSNTTESQAVEATDTTNYQPQQWSARTATTELTTVHEAGKVPSTLSEKPSNTVTSTTSSESITERRDRHVSQRSTRLEDEEGGRNNNDLDITARSFKKSNLKFPIRLYLIIDFCESNGMSHVMEWVNDGQSFAIYDWQTVEKEVLLPYFGAIQRKSFLQNLREYDFIGFHRGKRGIRGNCKIPTPEYPYVYNHPKFRKGRPELLFTMKRKGREISLWADGIPRVDSMARPLPFSSSAKGRSTLDSNNDDHCIAVHRVMEYFRKVLRMNNPSAAEIDSTASTRSSSQATSPSQPGVLSGFATGEMNGDMNVRSVFANEPNVCPADAATDPLMLLSGIDIDDNNFPGFNIDDKTGRIFDDWTSTSTSKDKPSLTVPFTKMKKMGKNEPKENRINNSVIKSRARTKRTKQNTSASSTTTGSKTPPKPLPIKVKKQTKVKIKTAVCSSTKSPPKPLATNVKKQTKVKINKAPFSFKTSLGTSLGVSLVPPIGTCVWKMFGNKGCWYEGKVTEHRIRKNGKNCQETIYHISYEDGHEEDLSSDEAKQQLILDFTNETSCVNILGETTPETSNRLDLPNSTVDTTIQVPKSDITKRPVQDHEQTGKITKVPKVVHCESTKRPVQVREQTNEIAKVTPVVKSDSMKQSTRYQEETVKTTEQTQVVCKDPPGTYKATTSRSFTDISAHKSTASQYKLSMQTPTDSPKVSPLSHNEPVTAATAASPVGANTITNANASTVSGTNNCTNNGSTVPSILLPMSGVSPNTLPTQPTNHHLIPGLRETQIQLCYQIIRYQNASITTLIEMLSSGGSTDTKSCDDIDGAPFPTGRGRVVSDHLLPAYSHSHRDVDMKVATTQPGTKPLLIGEGNEVSSHIQGPPKGHIVGKDVPLTGQDKAESIGQSLSMASSNKMKRTHRVENRGISAKKIKAEEEIVSTARTTKTMSLLHREKEANERAMCLMRVLSTDELRLVEDAMNVNKGAPEDIVATLGTDTVQRSSMWTLSPGKWVSDEIMHSFFHTLCLRDEELYRKDPSRRRCHFFKSFFMTKLLNEGHPTGDGLYTYENVESWNNMVPGKDIFRLDKVFIPINVCKSHWILAVIFISKKIIQIYDSLGKPRKEYLNTLLWYLKDEHLRKKGYLLPTDEWKLLPTQTNIPRQRNPNDCGVFTCMFAEFVSQELPLTFDQEHVNHCRNRIALSILKVANPSQLVCDNTDIIADPKRKGDVDDPRSNNETISKGTYPTISSSSLELQPPSPKKRWREECNNVTLNSACAKKLRFSQRGVQPPLQSESGYDETNPQQTSPYFCRTDKATDDTGSALTSSKKFQDKQFPIRASLHSPSDDRSTKVTKLAIDNTDSIAKSSPLLNASQQTSTTPSNSQTSASLEVQRDIDELKQIMTKRRAHSSKRLPHSIFDTLCQWVTSPEHIYDPFPTANERNQILKDLKGDGYTEKQRNVWFSRFRKEIWFPFIKSKLSRVLKTSKSSKKTIKFLEKNK